MSDATTPCPGCGVLLPPYDGPIHRYMISSPACWAVYGEVLAREYSDQERWPVHRMTVDTYAVQHPGTPSPQSIQSVAIHLVRLHLALERGLEPAAANAVMQRAAGDGGKPSPLAGHTRWLDPPAALQQTVTAVDVHRAADAAEHRAAVERWAAAVWDAWRDHHAVVREWAAVVVGE